MAWKPYSVDESVNSGAGGSAHLPEGTYKFEVLGVSPSPEDHNGDAYFRWKVIARDGLAEGIGGVANHTITMKEGAQFGLCILCEAVGIDKAKMVEVGKRVKKYLDHAAFAKLLEAKAKGKFFAAAVMDREYTTSGGDDRVESQIVTSTILEGKAFSPIPAGAASAPARKAPSKKAVEEEEEDDEELENVLKAALEDDEEEEEEEDEDEEDDEDEDDDEDEEDDEDDDEEEKEPAPPARRTRAAHHLHH